MGDDMIKKLTDTAKDAADEHGDKIESGIDKVADLIDDKTGGKHSEKIDDVADKAKNLVEDAGGKSRKPKRKRRRR